MLKLNLIGKIDHVHEGILQLQSLLEFEWSEQGIEILAEHGAGNLEVSYARTESHTGDWTN